ncbi:MAG: hypothetical protein OEM52_15115, partial [bacterium]|nr:hypothetical protein [bacterium]
TGVRQYRKRDFELIKVIVELLYNKRYTIEGAKAELQAITKEEPKPKQVAKPEETERYYHQSNPSTMDVGVTQNQQSSTPEQLVKRVTDDVVHEPPMQIGLFDHPTDPDSLL